ncbi:MAG TPA: hypothetical protein VGC69_13190 [Bordetella sp.]
MAATAAGPVHLIVTRNYTEFQKMERRVTSCLRKSLDTPNHAALRFPRYFQNNVLYIGTTEDHRIHLMPETTCQLQN